MGGGGGILASVVAVKVGESSIIGATGFGFGLGVVWSGIFPDVKRNGQQA